jgi:hypothetical protein
MGIKIPVVIKNGFTFQLEFYKDKTFVHCDVFKTTKAILREMYKDWEYFRKVINIDLYALHSDSRNNKTHKHFLRLFGFSFLESGLSGVDESPYELWVNRGNTNAQIQI